MSANNEALTPGALRWVNPAIELPPLPKEAGKSPKLLIVISIDETPWPDHHDPDTDAMPGPVDRYVVTQATVEPVSGEWPNPAPGRPELVTWVDHFGRRLVSHHVRLWALPPEPPSRRSFADMKAQKTFYATQSPTPQADQGAGAGSEMEGGKV